VGVISGAYSTIYVASPVLLWLENRAAKKGGGGDAGESVKSKSAVTTTT
jgi:preprotein translocase subunit SecF